LGTGGIEPPMMDSRGIEPRTTPMLREYYTTKPQAPVGKEMHPDVGRFLHEFRRWMMLHIQRDVMTSHVGTQHKNL
jgi:hypothetical protein